ncbi:uncharacterized protein [Eurosta solidaginis]|uniref:uncharacterized protein n=1 Tax=Eurosta solidaginis TaxID=178769 RepID=UPI0035309DFD
MHRFIIKFIVFVAMVVEISTGNQHTMDRPAPKGLVPDENISFLFLKSASDAESAKSKLQSTFQSFLENLQQNFSSSAILQLPGNSTEKSHQKRQKIKNHIAFFEIASVYLMEFAFASEHFLQVTKNESIEILFKLRRYVKKACKKRIPTRIKSLLTTFFADMDIFNVMFSETVDEGLEYIVQTLQIIQTAFDGYTDTQKRILLHSCYKFDDWCYNQCFEFLLKRSAYIYHCASNAGLERVYNIYAMTETITKHIMRQLALKVQRLLNCLTFNEYNIKCSFLRHTGHGFQKIYAILKDLQAYYNIELNREGLRDNGLCIDEFKNLDKNTGFH